MERQLLPLEQSPTVEKHDPLILYPSRKRSWSLTSLECPVSVQRRPKTHKHRLGAIKYRLEGDCGLGVSFLDFNFFMYPIGGSITYSLRAF